MEPRVDIDLLNFERDPYPILEAMRAQHPVAWVPQLNMWYVTGYQAVDTILRDFDSFETGTTASLLFDTFGTHMLTIDGVEQKRHRDAFRQAFAPAFIRTAVAECLPRIVDRLIDQFIDAGRVDLRAHLAARLPILVMLDLFGLSTGHEGALRRWYDSFERALANFTWDDDVRAKARENIADFHALIRTRLVAARTQPEDDLVSRVIQSQTHDGLTDDEITRNVSIIFFGGISTVEALILNLMSVIVTQPSVRDAIVEKPARIGDAIEETMRWMSPVQSATRHVVADVTVGDVSFRPGETVNCMLGAANRDPAMFQSPNEFDLDRPNKGRHLGFASGPHFCLGSHLARLEARAAVLRLLERCPDIALAPGAAVEFRGYEFRQPDCLALTWTTGGA